MNAPAEIKIAAPGLYKLSEAVYHGDPCPLPSLSAGGCETLLMKSAAHAYAEHPRLGNTSPFEESAAMDVGTVAHALLFEGIDKMAVIKFDDWRTNAAKAERDAARADGKIPVLEKQVEPIKAMVASARRAWTRNHDLFGYTLDDGVGEQSAFWSEDCISQDAKTWFRMRPDWLSSDRKIILDGKFTGTSAHPAAFQRQIENMAYDLRAAFYCRGVAALFDTECKYLFLVVEDKPPFEAAVIGLAPSYMALGEDKVQVAVSMWQEGLATGKWPGYGNRIFYVEAPAWAQTQWVERSEINPHLLEQA